MGWTSWTSWGSLSEDGERDKKQEDVKQVLQRRVHFGRNDSEREIQQNTEQSSMIVTGEGTPFHFVHLQDASFKKEEMRAS